MKHIYVRPFRMEDRDAMWQWLVANAKNDFDPGVLLYPTTSAWAAFNQDGVFAYMPLQRPMMIESFGFRPGITELEQAAAMKAMTQAAVREAYGNGAGEIYFLTKDDETAEFAKKHAYEELNFRIFRIKLRDLEGAPNEASEVPPNTV